MLSILILAHSSEGRCLADKLVSEGHIVKYWSETESAENSASNVHPWQTVNRYQSALETADLCVFVSSGFGGLAEELRARGKMVVGGTLLDLLVEGQALEQAAKELTGLVPAQASGLPIQLSVLYDGETFLGFVSQMYNRLLDKDRGPEIPMGCVTCFSGFNPLYELKPILDQAQFRGCLRLSCFLSERGLEATQFELNQESMVLASICESMGISLSALLVSVATQRLGSQTRFQVGSAACLIALDSSASFQPSKMALKHSWRGYDPTFLGWVSAGGQDLIEARRRIHRTINNHANSYVVYRNDIGVNSILEEERTRESERSYGTRPVEADPNVPTDGKDRQDQAVCDGFSESSSLSSCAAG